MKIIKRNKKLKWAFGFLVILGIASFVPIIISCSKVASDGKDTFREETIVIDDLNLLAYLDDDSGVLPAFKSNNLSIKDKTELDLKLNNDTKYKFTFLNYDEDKNKVNIENNKISYKRYIDEFLKEIDKEKLLSQEYEKDFSIQYFYTTNSQATNNSSLIEEISKSKIYKKSINENNIMKNSNTYSLINQSDKDNNRNINLFIESDGKIGIDLSIQNKENQEDGVYLGIKSFSVSYKKINEEDDSIITEIKSLNDYYLDNHIQNKYDNSTSLLKSDIFNSEFSSFDEWKNRIDSFIELPQIDLVDPEIQKITDGINLVNESEVWIGRDNLRVGNPNDKNIGEAIGNFISNIQENSNTLMQLAFDKLTRKDKIELGNAYFGKKEILLYDKDLVKKNNEDVKPLSKTIMIGGNKGSDVLGNDISSIKGDYTYDFRIDLDQEVKEASNFLFSTSGISASIMHQIEGRKYDGGGITNISYPSLNFTFLNSKGETISTKKVIDESFKTDYTNESFNILTYSGSNVELILPQGTSNVLASISINIDLNKSGEKPRWDDYLNTFLRMIGNVVSNLSSYGSSGAFKFLFDGSVAGGSNIFTSFYNSFEAIMNNPYLFGISLAGYEDNSVQDLIKLVCPQVKPYVSTIFDIGYDGRPKWDPKHSLIDNYQWQSIQTKAISNALGLVGSSLFNALFGIDLSDLSTNKRADINNVIITTTSPKAILVNLDAKKQIEKKIDFSNQIQNNNFKKVSRYISAANSKIKDQKSKYNEFITKMKKYYDSTINNLFSIISNKDMSFVERNINNASIRLAKELEDNIIQVGRNTKDYNFMSYLKNVADDYFYIANKNSDIISKSTAPDIISDTYLNKIKNNGTNLTYLASLNYSGSIDKITVDIEEEQEINSIYKRILDIRKKLEEDKINNTLTEEEIKDLKSEITKLELQSENKLSEFNKKYQKYSDYLSKEVYWVSLLKQLTRNQAEWLLNNAFYSLTSTGDRVTVPFNYRYIDNEDKFDLVNGIDLSYKTLSKSNLSQEDINSIMNLDINFFKILIKNIDFKNLTEIDLSNLNISGNFNSLRKDIFDLPFLMGENSNLKYINLSGNELTDFEFAGLKNIQSLDLSHNQLSGNIKKLLEDAYKSIDSSTGLLSLNLYKNFLLFPKNENKTANELIQDIHNQIYDSNRPLKWQLTNDSLTWQISVLEEKESYSTSINGSIIEKTTLSDSYITYLEPLGFDSSQQNLTAKVSYEILNDELHVKDIFIPDHAVDSTGNDVVLNDKIIDFFKKEIKETISEKKLVSINGIYQFMNISKVNKEVLNQLGIDSLKNPSTNFNSITITYSNEDNKGSFDFEETKPNVISITNLNVVSGDPLFILRNNNIVSEAISKNNDQYFLNLSYSEFNSYNKQTIWRHNEYVYLLGKELFSNFKEEIKEANDIYIPNGINVIAEGFLENKGVNKLILPDSIITIKDSSFKSNNITELELSKNILEVGIESFAFNNISNIVLNNKLQKINRKAFYENNIQSLLLPETIQVINYGAFANNLIENILLPKNLEYLGYFSFANNMIKEVTIESNETLWANNQNLWLLVNKFDDPINTAFKDQKDNNNIEIKTELKVL